MAEVLHEFADTITSDAGKNYMARACGGELRGDLWQGWIEFVPLDGGKPIRSARETTQPNRQDAIYWASGLTPVYLEGALRRAERPATRVAESPPAPPHFDQPAEPVVIKSNGVEAVLDPFSVVQGGEPLLRRRLSALAGWHLVNIIRKYALSDADPAQLAAHEPAQLAETIISAVRDQTTRRQPDSKPSHG